MYHAYPFYPCPSYVSTPMNNLHHINHVYGRHPHPYWVHPPMYNPNDWRQLTLKDYGPAPFVVNINEATKQNNTFRTALWTGENLQVTLMSLNPGEDIGLEIHPTIDQFTRVEEGQGIVQMGDRKDQLDFQQQVYDDYATMIPAGKWHNVINTGDTPLKFYVIYAPPEHPRGTVHETKADAEAAEEQYRD